MSEEGRTFASVMSRPRVVGLATLVVAAVAFGILRSGGESAGAIGLGYGGGPGAPATLVLSPPSATNPVGTQHCVTATVKDAAGNPTPNVIVRFSVTGSVTTSGSQTTNGNGQATFCYLGPQLPGADVIRAFADSNGDGSQNLGEPGDLAEKTWVLPASTPGCVVTITNGGWIIADNGDRGSFGGNAEVSSSSSTSGQEEYQDHGPAQPLNAKSISVLAITCSQDRKQASIFGRATVNGSGSFFYRIDVSDLGEPGVGKDTYRILLATGYDSGDHVLRGGNVQIH